ncbi:MAG: hypothetical protein CL840_18510 [Crocinitomicaceae bacterium]|nr:hypothetical protein [Crocinitomicaceae bacterium]|tara:strand:- start:21024 stop:22016 length:993 start_codon:yes stop_codon:yes gene_type:complete
MPFNGRFLHNTIIQSASRGARYSELINKSGRTEDQLLEENSKIEFKDFNSTFELALKQVKDPLLGIHISQTMNLSAAGLITQLAQNSATVKEAIMYSCEYAMLGCESMPMRLHETEYTYDLVYYCDQSWRLDSEVTFQHTLEGSIQFLLKQFEILTNKKFSPIKVTLDYQPRVNFKKLQKYFNAPVFIREGRNSIVFKKQDLNARIASADHELLKHLLNFAEERKDQLQKRDTIVQQVSKIIINTLPDRAMVKDVAMALNLSVRSLQRRLNYEDTSFRDLLESLLMEFAKKEIQKGKYSLSELAYILNYSDLSAFSRAYRNYFGTAPTKG